MKEKMRSTMKKGAAAIQQATKNPPSLQDILKKKNASGSGEERNEGGDETASKPTLAGATAAALAKTKTKAQESMMAQQQKKDEERGGGEKDALKEAMKAQKETEKKFVTHCETWLKRKRAFRDIAATIVEGSSVKEKDLMKQLEIETDEANGVEEKEFRALLDGLKKKMRADEMNKMMNKKRKLTAA